jgi:glycosyltransferase involved in cell wall biosynthesis
MVDDLDQEPRINHLMCGKVPNRDALESAPDKRRGRGKRCDELCGSPGRRSWRRQLHEPLRVAHVTPAYFSPDSILGGGERYVYYLAQSLCVAGGFEQCVFAMGAEDRLFEHKGISVRVLRNESPLQGAMNAFSAGLWRYLLSFDLVHVHQSLTLFGAYTIAIVRSLGIPAVGTDLGGGENALMLSRRGVELLDGTLSISRYAHDTIAKFFSGHHEILIGPVDTDHFSPATRVTRDRRTVLCVGRIMPHKGIDRVIAALPPGLRLIVAGRVYHESYYELLRRMAEGKDVQFAHGADDTVLLELYRTARLFIQASTARDVYGTTVANPELMGLTTLEAMACGLPVAVSNTGSLPELVPDPRFGRVFFGHDDLSAILREVAEGVWPGADAAALARAHVMEEHGMEVIGQRLATFYRAVIARSRRPSQCAFCS